MFLAKLFLIVTFVTLAVNSGQATDATCTNALYQGAWSVYTIAMKINKLIISGQLNPRELLPTCQLLELLINTATDEFYLQGCDWGVQGSEFEDKVRSLLRKAFTGECEFFENITTDMDSLMCTPEDEVVAAVRHVVTCGLQKVQDHPFNGDPADLCFQAQSLAPCFDGLVDSCHNDDGEASDAILNALGALLAFNLELTTMDGFHPPGQETDFPDAVLSCSDDQLGWLTSLRGVDFSWTVDESSLPSDEELMEVISNGSPLNINDDFVQDFFSKRLGREIMGEAKRAARNEIP